jgi:Ni/Fe-hydrogenase subunit HybB-like protein
MDFATSVVPGWHTTIFPPYFVAGAIFSGFAMVLTLMLITRVVFKLEDYITLEHIALMNKIMMVTGSIVGVAYITEFFIAWYSQVEYEQYAFINRATGPYWWAYAGMVPSGTLQHCTHVHPVHYREHRYVVRALCNHRDFVAP